MRVVFKAFPVFGRRWPMSVQAARTGLTLWHLKGADAYLAYHHAVFASGEHEGRLSQPAIDAALQAAVTNARRRRPVIRAACLALWLWAGLTVAKDFGRLGRCIRWRSRTCSIP